MIKEGIRSNFRVFRVEKRLSQRDLGNLLGVTTATICFVETGRINGTKVFWKCLQNHFNLTSEEVSKLKEIDFNGTQKS